jgi:hypothetical protein
MARQIGPPVTIEGWLCRAVDDEGQPDVLAEATLFEDGVALHRAVKTRHGLAVWSRAGESTQLVPDAVLKALLKIGGWQVGPHVFKP